MVNWWTIVTLSDLGRLFQLLLAYWQPTS